MFVGHLKLPLKLENIKNKYWINNIFFEGEKYTCNTPFMAKWISIDIGHDGNILGLKNYKIRSLIAVVIVTSPCSSFHNQAVYMSDWIAQSNDTIDSINEFWSAL